MALHEFTLPELINLDDGRIVEAWRQAVARCALDCNDRPALDKPRKIMLQLEVKPIQDENGELSSITAEFQVKDSLPVRTSKVYSLGYRRLKTPKGESAQLVFNDMSLENVHQSAFEFDEGDEPDEPESE